MPELAEVEPQTTAGFVSRSRSKYKERIAKDEQELKDLLADKENPEQEAEASQEESVVKEEPKEEEESLSPEEKSFKIRYGDLRRHSQQKEKELKDEIERLKNSVNSAPPKTEDELKEWAEKYPDVAGMVETIASKKAKEMFDSANIQIEELAKKEEEATRNRALNDIRKAHKDFDELEKSKEFHDWVQKQPKWIYNALFENADDAPSVIRVLDLYKADNGLTATDKKNKTKAAASLVNKVSKTQVDAEELADTIKESDIEKMSDREYAANVDKINAARRSGKIIYDLSGNRR